MIEKRKLTPLIAMLFVCVALLIATVLLAVFHETLMNFNEDDSAVATVLSLIFTLILLLIPTAIVNMLGLVAFTVLTIVLCCVKNDETKKTLCLVLTILLGIFTLQFAANLIIMFGLFSYYVLYAIVYAVTCAALIATFAVAIKTYKYCKSIYA